MNNVKIKKIEAFYFITKIKEHSKIKNELLNLINKIPKSSYESITHTDWNLPKEYKREYLDYFYKIVSPYMEDIKTLLNQKTWLIQNSWFQQYYKNDTHDWHMHAKTNFTNVYYLELPKRYLTTKIKIMHNNKIHSIKATEGDLITFPACLLHTSKKIKDNLRKTIISFNSDFY
jgi:hypothetical protein